MSTNKRVFSRTDYISSLAAHAGARSLEFIAMARAWRTEMFLSAKKGVAFTKPFV